MASWNLTEVAPGLTVKAAHVKNASNNWQGDVSANGNILNDLGSVGLIEVSAPSTPASNKALVYLDSSDGKLKIKKDSGSIVDLESVAVSSVFGRTGAVVAVEGDYSLDKLSDVSLASPSVNDVLMFGGGVWGAGNVAVTVFGRSGTVTATEGDYDLNLMGDVVLTSVQDNDVLTYDSGTSKWVNAALGNSSLLDTGTTTGHVALADDSRFVTNGNSHDHNGGDGGTISHLNLSNIGNNSHATIDTRLAALGNSSTLDTGTSSGTVALGDDARFVTNGNSHDHNGGDGAQISHLNLSNIGTNSHATIDTRLAALGNSSILDTGTTTGTVALGDDLRFVTGGNSHDHNGGDGAQISHLNLSNIGTNSHATIDTHLASTSNPHSVTATQVGLGSVPNYPVATQSEAEAGTSTNKLMTPERVAQAINILVPHISGLNDIPGVDVADAVRDGEVFTYSEDEGRWVNRTLPSGIGTGDLLSTNNLSEITSASTARTNLGIGSVDNYATASQSQAEAGTATDKFMTPQRTAQAVAAIATGTGLGALVATSVSFGSTPSTSGTVKMSNAGAITMRNFGNNADMGILGATSADILRVGYSNLSSIQLGKPTACLGILSSTVINNDAGITHEATTTNQMGFKINRTDATYGVTTYMYVPGTSTDFRINHASGDRITVKNSGRVLIGTTTDDGANAFQVNGQIRTVTKTPSSATDTGVAGTMCWDASYVYVCTATNTWKRSAISTW